jgi:hypothetical protein
MTADKYTRHPFPPFDLEVDDTPSEKRKQLRRRADVFQDAADAWVEANLPAFVVTGHLDGKPKTWTVPEVLKLAAERILEAFHQDEKERLDLTGDS